MLKKLLSSSLIVVLSTGVALGSVSAAESEPIPDAEDTNKINAIIESGGFSFEMDSGALNFEGIIDQESNENLEVTLKDEDEPLGFKIEDNRGIKEDFTVQYTLTEFKGEEENTLTTTEAVETENVVVETFDPEVKSNVTGTIDLSDLVFEGTGFIVADTYTATMTTSVVTSPEPE